MNENEMQRNEAQAQANAQEAQKTENDLVRQIGEVIQNASTAEEKKKVILAEQTMIGFFYDMMAAIVRKNLSGKTTWPDFKPMQDAVCVLNQACENQGRPYLFQKDIDDVYDLFEFSHDVAGSPAP